MRVSLCTSTCMCFLFTLTMCILIWIKMVIYIYSISFSHFRMLSLSPQPFCVCLPIWNWNRIDSIFEFILPLLLLILQLQFTWLRMKWYREDEIVVKTEYFREYTHMRTFFENKKEKANQKVAPLFQCAMFVFLFILFISFCKQTVQTYCNQYKTHTACT